MAPDRVGERQANDGGFHYQQSVAIDDHNRNLIMRCTFYSTRVLPNKDSLRRGSKAFTCGK